jgi:hypothetical protein
MWMVESKRNCRTTGILLVIRPAVHIPGNVVFIITGSYEGIAFNAALKIT